jgi:EpsI family protein
VKAQAQANPAVMLGFVSALQIIALAILVGIAYRDVLPALVLEWYEHENFSYGFLIPVIFGYLVWDRRDALKAMAKAWSPWGIASLGLAVLLGMLGQAMGEPFVSRVSLVMVIGALVHLFWGWQSVRCLTFPLAYLFLMVPPPYPIVKAVSYYLRMFDAAVAERLLPLAGVPVYRDAYFLQLPNITLEVADICSGIASLFAMVALGALYAYYLPVSHRGKLAVLTAALVLPIIANLFRIFLIGVSVYYYGPIMLRAFFHSFTGTFTFLLSLGMLLAFGEWLRRNRFFTIRQHDREVRRDARDTVPLHAGFDQRSESWISLPFSSAVIIFAMVLLASGWSGASNHKQPLPELERIPLRLGNYEANDGKPEDSYTDPNVEAAISRIYESSRAESVEVFVGYRSRQFGVERLRSPKLVFPEGWEYAATGGVTIPIIGSRNFDTVWIETRKGAARKVVLFWYQVRGLSLSSDLDNRLELLRGLLFHGRTDAAVVRLSTAVRDTETIEQAKQRLLSVSTLLHPELLRVMPN